MKKLTSSTNRILKTVFGALFLLFITAQRHAAINLIFVFLFLIPSFIHSAVVCYRNKEEVKVKLAKAVIWLFTIIVIISIHVHMHNNARLVANQIAEAIALYEQAHGAYPASVEDVGFSKQYTRSQGVHYINQSGNLSLIYLVTFMPFDIYLYDFKGKKWNYQSS
jgi:succinate dehydrogenase hydrophobic anchor subunit